LIFAQSCGEPRPHAAATDHFAGLRSNALIEEGRCAEATLLPEDPVNADVYRGNSLRGLIRPTAR
jgi:hypothetical protein